MIGSSDSFDWLSDCLVSWLTNWFGKEWNLGFGFVWDWSLAACLPVCLSVCLSVGLVSVWVDWTLLVVPPSREKTTLKSITPVIVIARLFSRQVRPPFYFLLAPG